MAIANYRQKVKKLEICEYLIKHELMSDTNGNEEENSSYMK